MPGPSLYLMSPHEIVLGYLFGFVPAGPVETSTTPARDVLEGVVRSALERAPCGVAFSGGRDSSAVLAVAAHVARRDGLPAPVPITRVFPDAPASHEADWQESVIRHLGLTDWQRVTITDELDLVGPLARPRLREHGVVWPPMIHVDEPLLDHLEGGSLIDGEGGDEVLGVDAHRIRPVTTIARSPRAARRAGVPAAVAAARALAPAPVRRRATRRHVAGLPITWLRPAAHAELTRMFERADAAQPLSYASSVRMVPRRRTQVLMARNRRILGHRRDVAVSSPLIHPAFVSSLAADGGRLGRGSRTAALRWLVSDLLPDAILARTSKATFNEAYLGRHTAEFAERWTGEGVDDDLVDAEALRRHWCSDQRAGLTAPLLQQAWLHDDRAASTGETSTPAGAAPAAESRSTE